MSEYAVQLLTRMLEIYSPSGKEEEISNLLAKEMKSLGFRVRKDNVGNLIGEIGQGTPTVLLCGHMDTVAGYISVRVEDNNKLYGRGAVDAKASLAAMTIAASTFVKERLPGRILVAGVVDEEGSSRGIKHLVKEGISYDYAIFGEPSGVEKITIGYKGSLHLKITCKTQTGHSAAPWLFENAIEKALEVWRTIQKNLPQEKLGSHFYSITSCLTKIEGGGEPSIVPSKCDIHVELRIPPQFTPKQIFNDVKKIIRRYQAAHPKVSVRVKIEGLTDPFEVDRSSPLVRALSWAIRKVRSRPAALVRKTGTGDMNVLGNAMKIPVVTYGPGDSRLDHTLNEHIDLQEYLDSIRVYQEATMKLFELHGKQESVSKVSDALSMFDLRT